MVMLRNAKTAYKIAKKVLGNKNVRVVDPRQNKEVKPKRQYLTH